ncbi:MAG: hypothetical protein V5A88_01915 [Candidatus Thermoplasmatota archaeon]
MPDIDKTLGSILKGGEDLINTETLIVEAVEELVKDEIKRHIRDKIEENPELKAEFKEHVEMLMEAKMKEAYAYGMLAKTSADLGFELIPQKMKDEMNEKISDLMEKKMEQMMEREG